MSYTVVIIGAGAMGRTIQHLLRQASQPKFNFWDKVADKVAGQKPLATIVPSADIVFLCLHSSHTLEAVRSIKSHLSKKTIVVSVAKGIESTSQRFIHQVLEQQLPQQPTALLYGPMLAGELKRGRGGAGVIATKNTAAAHRLQRAFSGSDLMVEHSTDVTGVAVAGVLKNIYAIGLGITDGLGWGHNARAYLVTKAVNEMAGIITLLGGNSATAWGTAGLGDLLATGLSPESTNFTVGRQLVKTKYCPLESEGCVALPILVKKLGKKINRFALLHAIALIVLKRKDAKSAFSKLIAW